MPLNSKTIFYISLWMLFKSQEILCNDTWNPVTVSRALLGNKTLTTAELSASSDRVCAMTASRIHWPNLFCFSAGVCLFSIFMAVPNGNQASISDPEECMTKLKGCIYNGKLYRNGVAVPQPPPICSKFFCKDANLVKYPPVSTTRICASPFQMIGSGCFFVVNGPFDYCAASDRCDLLGAKLWTFPGMTNYVAYFNSINSVLASNSVIDFYLGIYANGSQFQWIDGSPFQVAANSSIWGSSYPSGLLDGMCVRTTIYRTIYAQPCTTPSPKTVCQKAI